MREIKFRAWDIEYKQWIPFEDIVIYGDGQMYADRRINGGDIVDTVSPPAVIFEQFTGLRDKSGKEIYEGDIVRLIRDDYDNSRFDGWIVSMRRPEYIELVSPDGGDGIQFLDFEYHAEPEVIGNIHENPELLEG